MERDAFSIKENRLSYGRGYVYSFQYHLVWCTKYRKKVLVDGLDTECKRMLQELAEEYRFQILAMEVMPDHIHLLVDCRKQKQQKTEIQKRKLREMIVCRLHPVMA